MMPFNVTELSISDVTYALAPGAAAILRNDSDEKAGFEISPFMMHLPDRLPPSASPDDRGRLPADRDHDSPGLRDAKITMSEPVRIDARLGYETRIGRYQRQGKQAGHRLAVAAVRDHRRCSSSALAARRLDPRRFRGFAPSATASSTPADRRIVDGADDCQSASRRLKLLSLSADLIC